MNFFQAIFIGFIQGITEWLPISSSGQVMLVLINLFKIPSLYAYEYSLILHLGTFFALVLKFRKELIKITFNFFSFKWKETEKFLFFSTIFTGIVGLPIYIIFKTITISFNPELINGIIGLALIFTGIVLYKGKKALSVRENISFSDSIVAGICQGISIIPGISRSGMTIGSLLIKGINQKKAVKLSFLMAIPAIIGIFFIEIPEYSSHIPLFLMLLALLSSFIFSFLTIEIMLKIAQKLNFSKFCFFFGIIAIMVSTISFLLG